MASPLSENDDLVSRLKESARRGDWQDALQLASKLPDQELPTSREELSAYLRTLAAALIEAKACRSDAVASLSRLNAAASFNSTPLDAVSERQDCADPADF
jgi:uncharacterized protein (DUF2236 family)